MPKVTLLSHLEQTCGCREIEVDAANVSELLKILEARFGNEFAAKLRSTKVMVNGVNVTGLRLGRTPLRPGDHVSLLPPLAGG